MIKLTIADVADREAFEEFYTSNVAVGVPVLDAKKPDWFQRVNLDTLDLASDDLCVLGQLFGTFDDGLSALHIRGIQSARNHGFLTNYDYAALNVAWREVIEAKRAAVSTGKESEQ